MLREIAYCYTEGSFCQEWLLAQVQKSPGYHMKPLSERHRDYGFNSYDRNIATDADFSNAIINDFMINNHGYQGSEYLPMKLKCGLAPIRNNNNNNRRNVYNMLKIIGGKAARKGEWPWQVAIFNRFKVDRGIFKDTETSLIIGNCCNVSILLLGGLLWRYPGRPSMGSNSRSLCTKSALCETRRTQFRPRRRHRTTATRT